MNPLILPVIFYNDETAQTEELNESLGLTNVKLHPDDYDLMHVYIFGEVISIGPHRGFSDNTNVSTITLVGNVSYSVYLSPEDCLAKVIDWMRRKQDKPIGWATIHEEQTKIQE